MRSFGIDTIGLAVPAAAGGGRRRMKLPRGGVISFSWGRALIEASIPKRIYGHNLSLVTTETLVSEIALMLEEANELMPIWIEDPTELRIARLDVARDFEHVHDPERLLPLIAVRPLRQNWPTSLTGTKGHLNTLKLGASKNWRLSFYDKSHETGHDERALFVLRSEARLRSKTLAQSRWAHNVGGVVRCLADLDDEKLHALARGTFLRVRADEPVTDEKGTSFRLDWDEGSLLSWPPTS